jgi:phage-related minor tail protein
MSMADEFRQYAEDALRWAEQSKTASEKQALIELARTWSQAAVQIGRTMGPSDEPQAQRMP